MECPMCRGSGKATELLEDMNEIAALVKAGFGDREVKTRTEAQGLVMVFPDLGRTTMTISGAGPVTTGTIRGTPEELEERARGPFCGI